MSISQRIIDKILTAAVYSNIKNRFYIKILTKIIKKNCNDDMTSLVIRDLFKIRFGINVGLYSYGGCFNEEHIQPNTTFGKFCSVASNVYVYNRDHPKFFVTTHPFLYSSRIDPNVYNNIPFQSKIIENDVWIGQNAILLPNAKKIGNGAIIAAGAVVTKDIPDYAIVAGVPAKIISFRFPTEQIEWLLKIKWWDWPIMLIKKSIPFMNDFAKFKQFYEDASIN